MDNLLMILGILDFFCLIGIVVGIVMFVVFLIKKREIRVPITVFLMSIMILFLSTMIYERYFPEQAESARIKSEQRKIEKEEEKQKENEQKEREKAEGQAEKEEKEKQREAEAQKEKEWKERGEETEPDKKRTEEEQRAEESEKQRESNQSENHDNESKAGDFLEKLENALNTSVAEKADDILKKQIGFENLEYKGKMDGLTNYEINADGHSIVLTASDDVYRIFIPNSSYVFYEDGEVKLTAEKYLKSIISWEDENQYYIIAKTIISDCIKGSTKFPSDATGMERNGGLVAVQGTVQGKNAFNATVEEKWTVEFLVYDLDNWSYEPIYIKLGNEVVGEFIELEDWEE